MEATQAARRQGRALPAARGRRRDTLGLAAAPLVLIADLASKTAVRSYLEPGAFAFIVDDVLRLRLGFNSGVAFGLLADGGTAVVWLTGVVSVALLAWLVFSVRSGTSWRRTLPLGLIVGGAFGNLLDRLPDGLGTDFVDVGLGAHRWPSFNVADSSIFIGVLGLVLLGGSRTAAETSDAPTS